MESASQPRLREQLADSPEDLPNLVRFVALRVLGDDASEQDALTTEVVDWIDEHLGRDYAWPGNFREPFLVIVSQKVHMMRRVAATTLYTIS